MSAVHAQVSCSSTYIRTYESSVQHTLAVTSTLIRNSKPAIMSAKRPYDSPASDAKKNPSKQSAQRQCKSPASVEKKRKAITLDTKLKILAEHEGGKQVTAIARDFGLSQSTVSTIVKYKSRISEAVKSSTSVKSTIISKKRAGPIDDMERLLVTWMEDQIQKRIPLSLLTIQSKARSLFEFLKERADDPTYTQTFIASNGWFHRFKKRNNFHNVKVSGEAASADAEAAEVFKEELDRIIIDENYLPEQIFNVDETGLFWKRMPERTYIHQEAKIMPGFKAFKDRVTLLLGGNVAGFKLKPFLIYYSENPRVFKNVSKHTLPVFYRHNKEAWMTMVLFEDWFLNCFIPQAKHYCQQNNIPFKILLMLDSAHRQHLTDMNPNVKVVFFPPNTTSLIQPMDQGAIASFKAYYLRQTFAQAVQATESGRALREFWKGFNILNAIRNIDVAWEEVTRQCMNGIWKKVLKSFVSNITYFNRDTADDEIHDNILVLGKQLEFEMDEEDVHQLVGLEAEELSNEELIELEESRKTEAETEEAEFIPEAPKFTAKKLAEAFAAINSGVQFLEEMDVNYERVAKADRQIQNAIACYREIYNEKKKQTVQSKMDIFVKKTTCTPAKPSRSVDEAVPSTSDAVPSTSISQASSEESDIDDPVPLVSPYSSKSSE